MGIFKGAKDVKVLGKGQNILPGMHLLRVKKMITHDSTDPRNRGTSFAVHEFEVVKSEGGRPLSAKEGSPLAEKLSRPHRIGDSVSWVFKVNSDTAISNCKQICGAVSGDEPDSFGEEELELMYSPEQPGAGVLVWCDAFMIVTREKGNDFCVIRWSTADASDLED
jgi:hypothetical protein